MKHIEPVTDMNIEVCILHYYNWLFLFILVIVTCKFGCN
jgi:hypothetical protein